MDTNIVGAIQTGINVGTDRFEPLYASGVTWQATDVLAREVMATTGTLKNFYVNMANSDATFSRTFTIQKNGVDTAITITLATGATSGNDTTHTVGYTPGDTFSVHTSAGGATVNTGRIMWNCILTETGATSCVLAQTVVRSGTSNQTFFASIQGSMSAIETVAGNAEAPMPTAGTFKNFQFLSSAAQTGTKSFAATLIQNGSPTGITATITGGNSSATDLTHTVTVVAGDRFYWSIVAANTVTTANLAFSMEFDPTIAGESVHTFASDTAITSTTANRVVTLVSTGGWTTLTNDAARQVMTAAAVWKKLYVFFQADPTPGSYNLQLTKNGTPGNPSVNITAGNTSGNDTSNTLTTVVTDGLTMTATPSSTPTAPVAEWGIVSFITPPASSVTHHLLTLGAG